jgi:hypothetical protein
MASMALADDDTGRHHFHLTAARRLNRSSSIDRPSQRIDYAAQHRRSDRNVEQATRPADFVPFLQDEIVAHDRGADVVLLEIEHQAGDRFAGIMGGELQHFARDRRLEAVDASDAVAHLEHGADFADVFGGQIGGGDLSKKNLFELAGTENCISSH